MWCRKGYIDIHIYICIYNYKQNCKSLNFKLGLYDGRLYVLFWIIACLHVEFIPRFFVSFLFFLLIKGLYLCNLLFAENTSYYADIMRIISNITFDARFLYSFLCWKYYPFNYISLLTICKFNWGLNLVTIIIQFIERWG